MLTGMKRAKAAVVLAGFLSGMGALHFVHPKPFDELVPKALPGGPRTWTYLSGVAELAVGAAVAVPKTRRLGALAAGALFVAVFPANVKMAWDWRHKPLKQKLVAFGRLPLQVPLVLWALRVRRNAGQ
ncbi:hypothetical protein N8J89_36150 [Crossiella sp. CA-258035]|uniref:DoxX family protein n=1 Tax=Crossiella sp. CA-258035 TaxID=2981138 RepID=UPI0024BD440E|nr:hypothetical protein [Crossiella sp. CA-258035]WHT18488.1 hypothetical protein N8J89_36150 [Crossiella sp. CA-258035]